MKKIFTMFLLLLMIFTMLCGCENNGVAENYEKEPENNVSSSVEEAADEYVLADSSRKTFVNNCTRGFYYTFDLGDGVEAEYSFNDGVAAVTTFLYDQQFGATETGGYEIYDNVIVCNFGQKDVVIEYQIVNNDVEFTKIR